MGLYYDGNTGTYYYYDEKTKAFQFHSQVEPMCREPGATCVEPESSTPVKQEDDQEHKRKLKPKETTVSIVAVNEIFPVISK